MTAQTRPIPKPRRPTRWHRWLLFKLVPVLVLVLTALGTGVWHIAGPQGATHLAEELIESITGGSVSIHEARFGLDGTIELNHVLLRLPDSSDDSGRLIEAEHILIEHEVRALLLGEFRPTVLNITRPVIYQTQNLATGKFNFQILLEQGLEHDTPLPPILPEIRLPNAQIKFCEVDDGRLTMLGTVDFEGQLIANPDQTGTYDFALRETKSLDAPGAVITGTFSPHNQTFEMQVDHFALKGPHRNWLPHAWRKYWDEHEQGPTATVPKLRLGIEQNQYYAKITLDDVNLIPPYTPFRKARILMTGGSGSLTFRNRGVTIENLRGQIEGVGYQIDGEVLGFDALAPLNLTIRAPDFNIPRQPRYLMVMPEKVVRQFQRFQPSGRFSALIRLERKQHGGDLTYQGEVSAHDVAAVYDRFPYPLDHLRGRIRFDQEKIEVLSISGTGPTGLRVNIGGKVWPPGPQPAVQMQIRAENVPLDDVLYRALSKPQHRTAFDLFLNQPAYQSLLASGVIRSATGHEPDADPDAAADSGEHTPVFDLGGRVKITTHVRRKKGLHKPRISTEIDVAGSNVLYAHWPYPMHITEGRLAFEHDHVLLRNIKTRGLAANDSLIIFDGRIDRRDGQLVPDIHLAAQRVPVDKRLVASASPAQRNWLEQMHLTGHLNADGKIFPSRTGRTDFSFAIEVAGQATPFSGRLTLAPFTSRATLRRNRIDIDHMTAHLVGSDQGVIKLSGDASWAAGDRHRRLRIEGHDLRFEDPLADLLPPKEPVANRVHQLVAKYEPNGRYDVDMTVQSRPNHPTDYHVQLKPQTIELTLGKQRIALNDMAGTIEIRPDLIRFENIGASFADGTCSATGQVRLGAHPVAELDLSAESTAFEGVSRAFLPAAIRKPLDKLQLRGGFVIDQAKLSYRPNGGDTATMTFDGNVGLVNASAMVGVPTTEIEGNLKVSAALQPDQKWSNIDLDLRAKSLRFADRQVEDFTIHLINKRQAELLEFKRLQGQCYNGKLIGSGWIHLGEQTFQTALVLQDVGVDSFLKPRAAQASSPSDESKTLNGRDGLLSASLDIEGDFGASRARQGRGEIVIHNANLYELPLSLALLQVVNLTLPSAKSFERAAARYVVDDDTILFDRLVFESPTMQVAGTGTMKYGTRQLDLDMVSSNPSAPDLGHLSALFAKLKDELISIHVRGTLDKPKASVSAFRGTRRSWLSVFGKPRKPSATRSTRQADPITPDQ